MNWSAEADGFEYSYFRDERAPEPLSGPYYVRRKLDVDGCVFGELPDDASFVDRRVRCGEVWRTRYGHQLICVCRPPAP